jgi:RsiW-degrading membrane proteinase PrsW (M82 family)
VSLTTVFVLLAALVVSSALLLLVVVSVWWIDRFDREPIHLVAMVFLWGAAVAPAASIMAIAAVEKAVHWDLTASGPGGLAAVSLVGPFLEELFKAIGVVLVVFLTSKFDNPTDGVVYGTAVGLGFAVSENVVYGIGTAMTRDSVQVVLVAVVGRTLLSAGVHAVCSAAFGGFLGFAILCRSNLTRFGSVVFGFATAVVLHGLWNFTLTVVGPFAEDGTPRSWLIALPAVYVLYVATLGAFLSWEHRILKIQLAEEVSLELAPAWVLNVIPYYRRRIRSNWWPSRNERTVLSRLLTRIAFRKHAVRHLPPSEAAIASLEVAQLRQRLRVILAPNPEDAD